MKHFRIALVAFAAALVAGGTLYAVRQDQQDVELRTLSADAAGIGSLLYARPFVLDRGYTHSYRAEQPEVRAGLILVLAVNPELARPRETWNKVLYVGQQTAERTNFGTDSGRIVVLVPAGLDATGEPAIDLAKSPIFFGGLDLPERVDQAAIERELAAAQARGVLAPASDEIRRARAEGGPTLRLSDRVKLDEEIAALIVRYSSGKTDEDIARGLTIH